MSDAGDGELEDLQLQKILAFSAIDELQKDFEIGNLSASDYEELKSKYEEKAVLVIKQIDDLKSRREAMIDDNIESQIKALRGRKVPNHIDHDMCTGCGMKLVDDDNFCPSCGSPTEYKCRVCEAVNAAEALFCTQCGTQLHDQTADTN